MSYSARSIKGLVALVTGGSRGLGEATARRLVQQGASVAIWDLPSSNGQKVAEELGDKCAFTPVDVTKEYDIQEGLKIVEEKFKKLHIAVNCAGILEPKMSYNFRKQSPLPIENFIKHLNVNTIGTFNVIRLAVGLMAKNQPDEDGQKGVIINTSSIAANEGQRGQVSYGASKGGIVGMTLPLARDLECEGIRCCTISPGIFDTDMVRGFSEKTSTALHSQLIFPKRLGHPDDYAHLVQSIIENSMLNGCVIRLDGALRMSA